MKCILFFSALIVLDFNASAAIEHSRGPVKVVDRLNQVHEQVVKLEQGLVDTMRQSREAKTNMKRIQMLIKLQHEQRELGLKRLAELQETIGHLEERRGELKEKIFVQQKRLRKTMRELHESDRMAPQSRGAYEHEALEAPRRKLLARFADRSLRELEELRVDLNDADNLETHIQEERQQLAFLTQDLKEQESLLEFNRKLQTEFLKKSSEERIAQLENYRKMKQAETQVESMITAFHSRLELQKNLEAERLVAHSMQQESFARLQGKLNLPLSGSISAQYGRVFDPKSQLYIFKKGIEIQGGKNDLVRSVFDGKIAFSGELPDYGRVTIIDHGGHYYTLMARMGDLKKKEGDVVAAGEVIGEVDDKATPVYFEIRAKNVPVNPLQWILSSRH